MTDAAGKESMPALSPEQVDHVALLARLELTPDEKAKLTHDLNTILVHFERLLELDTEDVPPTSHAIPMQNVFREDVVRPSLPLESFLNEAPDARDGFFVVPRIVEV
jgi:aspartyl-tRNA(Asn)/glutamyl-tRNA(Gln) amidotransferase subunit C